MEGSLAQLSADFLHLGSQPEEKVCCPGLELFLPEDWLGLAIENRIGQIRSIVIVSLSVIFIVRDSIIQISLI